MTRRLPSSAALALAALVTLASLGGACHAQSGAAPAGMVKRVSGQATLERAGQPAGPLAVGQVLLQGDVVRTGADGSAGITLADDTLLAAGPDSHLVIDRFAFDSTTQDGSILLRLWRGTLGMVTGLVARRAPQNVQVQTRTVMLGVRGTEFIVDAGKGQP